MLTAEGGVGKRDGTSSGHLRVAPRWVQAALGADAADDPADLPGR